MVVCLRNVRVARPSPRPPIGHSPCTCSLSCTYLPDREGSVVRGAHRAPPLHIALSSLQMRSALARLAHYHCRNRLGHHLVAVQLSRPCVTHASAASPVPRVACRAPCGFANDCEGEDTPRVLTEVRPDKARDGHWRSGERGAGATPQTWESPAESGRPQIWHGLPEHRPRSRRLAPRLGFDAFIAWTKRPNASRE